MKQLQQLRKDVAFQKDFIKLIESIRNTAQLNYVKIRDIEGEYYEERLNEIKNFAAFMYKADIKSSFVSTDVEKSCFILVTPDSGLMGGLNNHVMDEYKDLIYKCKVEPLTMVLGEKGALELGQKDNIMPFAGYKENQYEINSKVEQIRGKVFEEILKGNIGKVYVVYPSTISFTKQIVKTDLLLPCVELLGDSKLEFKDNRKIILESSGEDMAAYLASEWLDTRLYMVLKDAKMAEYSARAVHLSASKQTLEEQLEVLEKELNQVRKELIDKQSREASSSQLLRKKKQIEIEKRKKIKEGQLI
jgi:ATP synthase F1 gamma subunit